MLRIDDATLPLIVPVVQINTLLAHLNYFSTNSVFKLFYNYEVKDHTITYQGRRYGFSRGGRVKFFNLAPKG